MFSHDPYIFLSQYREGFTVDDGPYRRLDDPSNADFLRSLAMGRRPRELSGDAEASGASGGNIVVGLVDKRTEDYVETFQSFSGTGESLGSSSVVTTDGVFDPQTMAASSESSIEGSDSADSSTTTSIAVRLPNGKRKIVKLSLTASVADLALRLREDSEGSPFRLTAGYPPQPLTDSNVTIEAAGLKGAQVSMQKVA